MNWWVMRLVLDPRQKDGPAAVSGWPFAMMFECHAALDALDAQDVVLRREAKERADAERDHGR